MIIQFGLALWIIYNFLAVPCSAAGMEVDRINKRLRSVGPSHEEVRVLNVGGSDLSQSLYTTFSSFPHFSVSFTGDPGSFSQLQFSFHSGPSKDSSGVDTTSAGGSHQYSQRFSEGDRSFDSSLIMLTNVISFSTMNFVSFSDSLYADSHQYSVISA
jgi:hypothetical protein